MDPLDFPCSSCTYSARMGAEDTPGKREKCSEPENLREGLGPTAEGAAEDSGQKLKQHDLSVSVTLEKT